MEFTELRRHWDAFGKRDALWAILTHEGNRDRRWDVAEFFATGVVEVADLVRSLDELGRPLGRRRALDFGCGVGRLTQALCGHFEECVGVDIAPSMIRLAKRYNRHQRRCRYDVNDTIDLRRFEDGCFDLVYSNLVLQHMRPELARGYVREFLRVVNVGGLAVFTLPRDGWPEMTPAPAASTATGEALPDDAFSAHIAVDSASLVAEREASIKLSATVRNTSSSTWPAASGNGGRFQINLGNHWLDARGRIVTLDDARAPLPHDLSPGEETALALVVTSPSRPGRYVLELDIVQEGVAWFQAKGTATTRIPVEVRRGTPWTSALRAFSLRLSRLRDKRGNRGRPDGRFKPRMEMYGVPPEAVVSWLTDADGHLLEQRVGSLPGECPNLVYYAQKREASAPPAPQRILTSTAAFRAKIEVVEPPALVERDTDVHLSVMAKTLSPATWPGAGRELGRYVVQVGNHWLDGEGRLLVKNDGRAPLPEDVEPEGQLHLRLWVRTPPAPGTYVLEVDLVQEYVGWFNGFGSETTRVTVVVR